MSKHPSHRTRFSDSSLYDEICIDCGAHDDVPGGWGKLEFPCPNNSRDRYKLHDKLHDLVKSHFNEPVICGFTIGRVIGYSQDSMDSYMIIRFPNGYQNPNKMVYQSMVGGYYFLNRLKGQDLVISKDGEQWDDYFRIDNLLKLNGCPEEKEFRLEIDNWDDTAYNTFR